MKIELLDINKKAYALKKPKKVKRNLIRKSNSTKVWELDFSDYSQYLNCKDDLQENCSAYTSVNYTPRWKQILFAITHPSTWVRCDNYDVDHDRLLQELMQLDKLENFDMYLAKFSNYKYPIWITNYPYSFGSLWTDGKLSRIIPSRHTAYLLKKYIESHPEYIFKRDTFDHTI